MSDNLPVQTVEREVQTYAGDEDRPLGSFAGMMGLYAALATGLGVAVRRAKVPTRVAPGDLLLLSVGTAKLARVLAHDRVTSPLRAPFTRFEAVGPAGQLVESPRGTGIRLAVGELATCPHCLAPWVGTGLLAAQLLRPVETRLVTALLTLLAVSDVVQVGQDQAMRHGRAPGS